jgi:uncharacterized membrane protein
MNVTVLLLLCFDVILVTGLVAARQGHGGWKWAGYAILFGPFATLALFYEIWKSRGNAPPHLAS